MKTTNGIVVGATKGAGAFTLTELAVVLAVVTLLAALRLLPALEHAKSQAQSSRCLSNMHQLMSAALMYADDSRGLWFYNQPGGAGSQQDWVTDEMDWGAMIYNGGAECTNWQLLVTPPVSGGGVATPGSFFTPYINSPSVYKCPADPSMALAPNAGPRARSYSANAAVGTIWSVGNLAGPNNTWADGPVTGQWLGGEADDNQRYGYCYQKTSDMVHPIPVNLWIFAEEHPDSINDSEFQVQIAQYTLGGGFIDMPANYHSRAGTFSFADGHVEIHKWLGTIAGSAGYVQGGNPSPFPTRTVTTTADLSDLNWLQARTSYPSNPAFARGFPQPH
jgi:prepilin-type processing-associated H-X9-DG protein